MDRIRHLALFLLILFCSQNLLAEQQSTCAAEQDFSEGLLWAIQHPEKQTSYLFGTIHLVDPEITEIPGIVEKSLRASKSFAMEVEVTPLASSTYIERSQLANNDRLDQLLGKKEFSQLSELVKQHYGLDDSVLLRLKPWTVFLMLGKPPDQSGKILDSVLAELAQSSHLDTSGLETMDELLDEMESLTLQDQLAILRDTVENFDKLMQTMQELKDKYLQQDLAGMVEINRRDHKDELLFERFMEHLLYRRNARMLNRMQPLLDEGRAFIAVGALHLAGERGLLCGLVNRGYQLKRLY